MKTVYCFYVFVFIVLLSRGTDGGLVKSFFEKVHDTAHKVHDDIHNVFHPTEGPKKESVVFENDKNDEPAFVFATSTVATNKEINKDVKIDQSYIPKGDQDTKESQLVFAGNPTPQPAVSGSTTTEKDGRENFAGGCSTGYQRTADGRCKPTF